MLLRLLMLLHLLMLLRLLMLGEALLEAAVVHAGSHCAADAGTKLLHLCGMLLLLLVMLLLLELMMIMLGLLMLLLVELGLAHAIGVEAVGVGMRSVLLGKLMLMLLRHLMMLAVILLLLRRRRLLLLIGIPGLMTGRAATSTGIHVPLARIALAGRERALVCHDGRTMSRGFARAAIFQFVGLPAGGAKWFGQMRAHKSLVVVWFKPLAASLSIARGWGVGVSRRQTRERGSFRVAERAASEK